VEGAEGVNHKYLGAFSERGVWVEMIKLQPRATWSSIDRRALRLLVVLADDDERDLGWGGYSNGLIARRSAT
jgi:hypothetical protein